MWRVHSYFALSYSKKYQIYKQHALYNNMRERKYEINPENLIKQLLQLMSEILKLNEKTILEALPDLSLQQQQQESSHAAS